MRRLRLWLLSLLGVVIIVPLGIVLAIGIALNTGAGRHWAAAKITAITQRTVRISRLSGHFPAYIAARRIEIADSKGVYLTINQATLRWNPLALLHRKLSIAALTAQSVALSRLPVPAKPKAKPTKSSFSLPVAQIDLQRLAINTLTIASPVVGHPITLHLTGHGSLSGHSHAAIILQATSPHNLGQYQIALALTPKTIQSTITATEPPHGLIGQFAGPKLDDGALALHATLAGPRQAATLTLAASLGALHANATGTVNLSPATPSTNITITLPNIAPFATLAGQSLTGSDIVHLNIARTKAGQSAQFDNTLSITGGKTALASWIGPKAQLTGAISTHQSTVAIHHLTLQTSAVHARLQGTVEPTLIALHGTISEPNITLIDPQLSGHVAEQVDIRGPRTDFALNTTINGIIAAKSMASGPFTVTIAAAHLPRAPTAKLTGSGTLDGAPLSLAGTFDRSLTGVINASLKQVAWKSVTGHGTIAVNPGHWPTGSFSLSVSQLSDIGKLLNTAVTGNLHAAFTHQPGQPVAVQAKLTRFALGRSIGVASAIISGHLEHPDHQLTTAATATITGLRAPQLAGGMTLSAQGPLTALALKMAGQFSQLAGKPAQINLTGLLSNPHHTLTLQTLAATARGVSLRLQHPTIVQWQPGLAVRNLAIGLGGIGAGGSLTVNGSIRPRLAIDMALRHIPASIIQAASPKILAQGQIDALAKLSGSLAAPQGTVTLAVDRLHLRTGPAAILPPVSASLHAQLSAHKATGTATLQAGTKSHLQASGSVPLGSQGPIALNVHGAIDLSLLNSLTAAQGTHVAGIITPALYIGGTLAAPQPNGTITLSGGAVRNIGSGLDLSSIAATLGAAGHHLALTNLQAKAGRGTIAGTGTVGLARPMPIDFHISLNQAQPISSDVLTETLSGQLHITGAATTGATIGGTVDIDRANINIPSGLPPSVAKLTILRPGETLPKPSPPLPIALNLTIIAKNQVFIRGDGVFADLGGRLHLGGTAAAPVPSGGLNLLRGHFTLGGKSLSFTKGNISFNGSLLPALDLVASHSSNDGTVSTLALTGTPTAPEITLSSVPYLPSDEVLSHLLYGTGTTHLSAFQAASLAASLAQLAGIGGGINPLGGIRNALGLDELSLGGGSANGAPTINAGRYVAPGVYVGASQAASGQGSRVKVEINLYKGLKLNTSVGNGSGSGTSNGESVGLGYQFNY
jgi:translocation and assembly module TamB